MTFPTAERFRPVARGGLGHPASTIAHAMAWFDGRLLVGTTAPAMRSAEDRGRILAYDPAADPDITGAPEAWQTRFAAPLVTPDDRIDVVDVQLADGPMTRLRRRGPPPDKVGRDFGIRSMTVFQGRSDPAPCLYAGTLSLWGGRVLRSADGRRFEPVTQPGMGDPRVLSFRGLTALDGRLFTAPAGTVDGQTMDRNLAPETMVFVSEDPASGQWQPACAPGFGDPANRGVFALGAAHGHLYAGTANPLRGFQLWRTDAAGTPPYRWTRVLTDGAFRYTPNLCTAQMAEFDGALYVGSGLPGFGYDKQHDIGPAAAELLRVHPDGSWDLLAGEPRFTPDGLKVPLSARGPGLDDPYNSVVWTMGAHDGALYLGMHSWEPYASALGQAGQATGGPGSPDGHVPGYQLWASRDGVDWTMVLQASPEMAGDAGLRTLLTTPAGLFLGSSNHTRLMQLLSSLRGQEDPALDDAPAGFSVLRMV